MLVCDPKQSDRIRLHFHPLRILALVLTCLIAASVFAADATDTTDADPVLFFVDGTAFRLSDFRAFIAQRHSIRAEMMNASGVRAAVLEMVDAEIFRREGERLGLLPEVAGGERLDGYYFMVQSELVGRCPVPDERELRAFFDERGDLFATPPFVRVARVALPVGALIEGITATRFLETQRLPFDELTQIAAAAYDAAGRPAPRMGDLGFQALGRNADRSALTELERALADATIGSVVGPIETSDAVFLLKVLDRRESVQGIWPQARGDVERAMARECRTSRLEALRSELYQRYRVSIEENAVSQLQPLLPAAPDVR